MNDSKSFPQNRKSDGFSVLLAASIALAPKCPLCCAAYLGLFSSLGIVSVHFSRWILPGLWTLLFLNLLALGFAARKRKAGGPFILSVLGTATILAGKVWLGSSFLCWTGVTLILIASAWNLAAGKCATPIEKGREGATT